MVHVAEGHTWPHQGPTLKTIFEPPFVRPMPILRWDGEKLKNVPPFLSKKGGMCQAPMDPPGGDQPESPHAFEKFVVTARWRFTWDRVYNSLTLQSDYKPSMDFTITCKTTHNIGPPGVLTVGTCSLRQSTNCLWKGGEVRKTLVLVRSNPFSVAREAEGRRSLRGMPEVSSLRACLKACKAAGAWALPGVPGGRA